jgi:hypothetical protein
VLDDRSEDETLAIAYGQTPVSRIPRALAGGVVNRLRDALVAIAVL